MTTGTPRWESPSWVAVAAAIAVLATSASIATDQWSAWVETFRLPLWDMAQNGLLGAQLTRSLQSLDLFAFLRHLDGHDTWPFGFSLLLVPFLWDAESGFLAATRLSWWAYTLVPVALVWVVGQVDRDMVSQWASWLAAGLWLVSPMAQLLSVLILRETVGCLATAAALALYLRARRLETLAAWRGAGLAALALFFIKYNYGLIWLAAAVLDSVWRADRRERRRAWRWSSDNLLPWSPVGWTRRLVLGLCWLGVVLYPLGVSVGKLFYGILLAITLLWAREELREIGRSCRRLRSLPPMPRAAIETLVVPIWVWCLSPTANHPRGVLEFVRNRSSELTLGEGALFYPLTWLDHYAPAPAFGLLTGALAVLGAGIGWWRGGGWRTIACLATVQILALTLHPYKEPRFLATAVPWLFLLAGLAAATALTTVLRTKWLQAATSLLIAAAMTAGFALDGTRSSRQAWVHQQYRSHSVDPTIGSVLSGLAAVAPSDGRLGLIGTFNELSPALIGWRLLERPSSGRLEIVPRLPRFASDATREEVAKRVERWVEKERPGAILSCTPDPESSWARGQDYRRYNRWQQRAVEELARSAGWSATRTGAAAGVRWTLWERAEVPPATRSR